jgi:hypothetical protein
MPRALVVRDIADGRRIEWGTIPDCRIEGWVLQNSRWLVTDMNSADGACAEN